MKRLVLVNKKEFSDFFTYDVTYVICRVFMLDMKLNLAYSEIARRKSNLRNCILRFLAKRIRLAM
jgi:hypothetical protein